jgi:hypothetical protein
VCLAMSAERTDLAGFGGLPVVGPTWRPPSRTHALPEVFDVGDVKLEMRVCFVRYCAMAQELVCSAVGPLQ